MIALTLNDRAMFAVRSNGVTLGQWFDSFYDTNSGTRGRCLFEARRDETGFEVWVGRRHLIIEVPALARALRKLAARFGRRPSE